MHGARGNATGSQEARRRQDDSPRPIRATDGTRSPGGVREPPAPVSARNHRPKDETQGRITCRMMAPCCGILGKRSPQDRTIQEEETMAWTKPVIREIECGMEINMYGPAEDEGGVLY